MAKLLIRNHKRYPVFGKGLSFDDYTKKVTEFWLHVSDELLASVPENIVGLYFKIPHPLGGVSWFYVVNIKPLTLQWVPAGRPHNREAIENLNLREVKKLVQATIAAEKELRPEGTTNVRAEIQTDRLAIPAQQPAVAAEAFVPTHFVLPRDGDIDFCDCPGCLTNKF